METSPTAPEAIASTTSAMFVKFFIYYRICLCSIFHFFSYITTFENLRKGIFSQ